MITLRTLKKKSKQAAPILIAHYSVDPEDLFSAERNGSLHGHVIRCTHGAGDPCRVKDRPRCDCTRHPLEGTPMLGRVTGGEIPEWEEETALRTLQELVSWHDRPSLMTDREWRRALAISGVTPVDLDAMLAAWDAEDGAP